MVLRSQPEKVEQVEADIEAFEVDMKRVLKVRGEGGGGGGWSEVQIAVRLLEFVSDQNQLKRGK